DQHLLRVVWRRKIIPNVTDFVGALVSGVRTTRGNSKYTTPLNVQQHKSLLHKVI
ncbi:hypothetical protein E4U44_000511, partial [Claviceps purpurea]